MMERDPNDGPGDTPDRPDIWVDDWVAMPGDGQPYDSHWEGKVEKIDFALDADPASELVDVSGDSGADEGSEDSGGDDSGGDAGAEE